MIKNLMHVDSIASNLKGTAMAQDILDNDRIFFPVDAEMRIFGSVEKLAQWLHRNRGPAFIRIGRRIGYHGSDLNAYLAAQRVTPDGEAMQ